jgi:multidrug efflux system membrane fusion protein
MTDVKPPRRRFSRISLIIALVLVAAGVGLWFVIKNDAPEAKQTRRGLTVPVALATIAKGDIDIIDNGLGTVTPLANVTIRTQIDGYLQTIAFQEGQIVHQGDLIAQIDDRPYQATFAQAEGALERDQALLSEALLDLARYQKLVVQDSISKQQLDTQASLVEQYRGAVATDQGQIDAAKLNIAYCHITAPLTGRVGLRQIDAGNYAQTSDTNGIVVLTQLDPISVLFTLPEDQLPAVMKQLAAGAELTATAYDRAGVTKLADGKLTAVDNQINTTTGTVQLRAQFENADGILFPNQFVNIQLKVSTVHDAVLAPSAAILRGAPGTYVYLAKDDGTVAVQKIKLGATQGDNTEVTDGLAAGDKVVIDGTDKLSDGAKYKLPEPAPAASGDGSSEKKQHPHNKSQ